MFLLLLSIFILHVSTIVLLFVATIDSSWVTSGNVVTDLWQQCNLLDSGSWICIAPFESQGEWLQAVQGLMVLSVVFSCVSLFLFIYQLYQLKKGGRFVITGIFHLLASLCVLLGAAVYTSQRPSGPPYAGGSFGHSYVITWVAFSLGLVNSVVYLFLRKRS
ncbi:peripheral myelin protein 22-like isoform X2 [Petromyzon marinus]|uniref:peripheral myelin protein 22-like isoform X2 n=1 Tax=Petromyzon marinus TaxID=7757 RepID=UPI003F71D0AA